MYLTQNKFKSTKWKSHLARRRGGFSKWCSDCKQSEHHAGFAEAKPAWCQDWLGQSAPLRVTKGNPQRCRQASLPTPFCSCKQEQNGACKPEGLPAPWSFAEAKLHGECNLLWLALHLFKADNSLTKHAFLTILTQAIYVA